MRFAVFCVHVCVCAHVHAQHTLMCICILLSVGSMSLSSEDPDRLYEVQVCVVNSPFSFYVQIRDGDQVQHSQTHTNTLTYYDFLYYIICVWCAYIQHLKIAELEKKMNQHYRKTPTKAESKQNLSILLFLLSVYIHTVYCT